MIGEEVEIIDGVPCVRAVLETQNVSALAKDLGKPATECGLCPVYRESKAFGWMSQPLKGSPLCTSCTKRGGVYVPVEYAPILKLRLIK
jgi:hypothetical protein